MSGSAAALAGLLLGAAAVGLTGWYWAGRRGWRGFVWPAAAAGAAAVIWDRSWPWPLYGIAAGYAVTCLARSGRSRLDAVLRDEPSRREPRAGTEPCRTGGCPDGCSCKRSA